MSLSLFGKITSAAQIVTEWTGEIIPKTEGHREGLMTKPERVEVEGAAVSDTENEIGGLASGRNARKPPSNPPCQAYCNRCGLVVGPVSGVVQEFGAVGRRHIVCPPPRVPSEKQLAARERFVQCRNKPAEDKWTRRLLETAERYGLGRGLYVRGSMKIGTRFIKTQETTTQKKRKTIMASKRVAKTTRVPAYIQDPDCTKEQIDSGADRWIAFEEVRANRTLAIRVIDAELAKLLAERRRVRQLAEALGVPERVGDLLDLPTRKGAA